MDQQKSHNQKIDSHSCFALQQNSNILQQSEEVNKSELFEQYVNFFNSTLFESDLSKYEPKLKSNRISYDKNIKTNRKSIIILNQSQNCQAVNVAVCFSHFLCEISILNLQQESIISEHLPNIGMGSSGNLYECRINKNEKFVIKSIFYKPYKEDFQQNNNQYTQKKLNSIIFEYCLNKLFSVFEVGPAILNQLGFDLVVYKSTVQFAMEFCLTIKLNHFHRLHSSLKFMHSLNIIHGDIKPQNILWSPTYQKNVFIDFGLSLFLKQNIGHKTFTHYFGTIKYSSPEMINLIEEGMGYVDLYYNDVHSIKTSLVVLANQRHHDENQYQNVEKINPIYSNFLFNIKLQKHIFDRDQRNVELHISKHKIGQILDITLGLMEQITYGTKLRNIINLLQQKYSLEGFRVQRLKKYLNKQIMEIPPNLKKKKCIEQRIHQILDVGGSINDIMFVFLFFFGEDITPRKKYLKDIEKEAFKKFDVSDQQFWDAYLKYVHNPFVSQSQILQSFEYLKQQTQIEKWDQAKHQDFTIFVRARQIKLTVLQKYNLDIDKLQIYFDRQKCFYHELQLINLNQMKSIADKRNNETHILTQFANNLQLLQLEKENYRWYTNYIQIIQALSRKYSQNQIPNYFKFLEQTVLLLEKSRSISKTIKIVESFDDLLEKFSKYGIPVNTFLHIKIEQQVNWLLQFFTHIRLRMNRVTNLMKKKYKKCFRVKQIIQSFFLDQFFMQIVENKKIQGFNFNSRKFHQLIKLLSLTNNKKYFLEILNAQIYYLFQLLQEKISQSQSSRLKSNIFSQLTSQKNKINLWSAQVISSCKPQVLHIIDNLYIQENRSIVKQLLNQILQSCQYDYNKFTLLQFNRFINTSTVCGLLTRKQRYLKSKQRMQKAILKTFKCDTLLYTTVLCSCIQFNDIDMALKAGQAVYSGFQIEKQQVVSLLDDNTALPVLSYYFGVLPDHQSYIFTSFLKDIMRYHHIYKKDLYDFQFYIMCLNLIKTYIYVKSYKQWKTLKYWSNYFLTFFQQLNKSQNAQFSTVYANLIIVCQFLLGFYYQAKVKNAKEQILLLFKYISIWVSNCNHYFKQFFSCKLAIYYAKFVQNGMLSQLQSKNYKISLLKKLRNRKYITKSQNLKNILKIPQQTYNVQPGQQLKQITNKYLMDRFLRIAENKKQKLRQLIESTPNISSCNLNMFYQLKDLSLHDEIWLYVPDRAHILKILMIQK